MPDVIVILSAASQRFHVQLTAKLTGQQPAIGA